MAGLITLPELLARPGFDGIDSTEAEALIEDASAEVRDLVSPLLDDVEMPDTPGSVVSVVVSMVRRGRSNPLGHTQEQLGDYGYSLGGAGVATLYLTRREKRIIRRAVGKLGAGSLNMEGDLPRQPSEPFDDGIVL